uniref:Uncharacterized protein n=1 Tax=Meloidogyne enterolobii TaxID=390850 RepID=A0A6V7X632_MELEN|nr:unnamed protein product [Meloidogyne enterolobii]
MLFQHRIWLLERGEVVPATEKVIPKTGMLFKQRPSCSSIGYGGTLLLEQTSPFWKNTLTIFESEYQKRISRDLEGIRGYLWI